MRRERTEEWAKCRGLVSEQIASGQSVAVFCRERGLRDWQFYEWKKRVRETEAAKFVSVEVAAAGEPGSVAAGKAIVSDARQRLCCDSTRGSLMMNTLITNELFMDFIECPYRGYLRLTGAIGRQTDFVELFGRLRES